MELNVVAIPKPESRAREKRLKARLKAVQLQRARRAALVRDGYRCRYCKSREQVEAHHLKPRSLGGAHEVSNLVALCKPHHDDRHAYRLFIYGENANGKLRFERV